MKYTNYLINGRPVQPESLGVIALPSAVVGVIFVAFLLSGAVIMDGGQYVRLRYRLFVKERRRLNKVRLVKKHLQLSKSMPIFGSPYFDWERGLMTLDYWLHMIYCSCPALFQQLMKIWKTEIRAKDPVDGKFKTWNGVAVMGETRAKTQENCRVHGCGYLKVTGYLGEFVAEVECDPLYDVYSN